MQYHNLKKAWHKGIFPETQKLISCKFHPAQEDFHLSMWGVSVHDDEQQDREKEKSWHLARMSVLYKSLMHVEHLISYH